MRVDFCRHGANELCVQVSIVMLEAVAANTLNGVGSVQNFTKEFSRKITHCFV